MYCKKCGNEIQGNPAFCPRCGERLESSGATGNARPYNVGAQAAGPAPFGAASPIPPAKQKKGRGPLWFLAGALVIAALVAGLLAAGIFRFSAGGLSKGAKGRAGIEGAGYDSPEEALTAYAEALRDQDIDRLLSTFSVETYVDNYDAVKQAERLSAVQRPQIYEYPISNGEEGFLRDIDVEKRIKMIISCVVYQVETLAYCNSGFDEDFDKIFNGEMLIGTPESDFNYVFEMARDIPDLSSLEVVEAVSPEELSDLFADKANRDNLKKQRKIIAADDYTSAALIVEIDGEEYYLMMDAACYDGKWYNITPGGNLGALMGLPLQCGGLAPVDHEL